ncbi:NUDIX hydrolase [Knoellia subterranea KCTC 19937]|uniref:NUDIX hydrolase n=1 Tax=Knoellia subterranea KCTC 19937 TaxID=1385521 RepID=A0A0A0JTR3_9MICO|nr:NUDIX hydrolase [Knoellia subterranea KCTC 19937]
MLNAKLPRKRNIAQGLLRNERGEILLCELTYKSEWDLPGGVVDPKESPAACVVREISEELSATVNVEGLVTVNWLPPWRGWDDAVLFLFDLGAVPATFTDDLTLLKRELKAVHWVAPADIPDHVAPYTARMLQQVLEGERTAYPMYLENSEKPGSLA